jgi:pimeloyl-ACP methyl ester carboxylesterase
MHSDFLLFGASRIHYSRWGSGKKLLLCFHGYGESAASFAFLEDALGSEFTILAPDMPFHGRTEWKDGLFFDPSLFPELIDKMIAGLPVEKDRAPVDKDRWWVLGYSMGGRVALSLLQKMPERIVNLTLLAPDGLKVNGWYWLATQSDPGNRVFRRLMQKPRFFFLLLRMIGKLRLLNPGIHKFMFRYIGDPLVREELYHRWTVMRGFRPDIRSIKSIIREYRIPVSLIYGRHDRIIRAERGEQFRKGIESWCRLYVLETGHGVLAAKFIDTISAALKE